jgi:hypothetical protein
MLGRSLNPARCRGATMTEDRPDADAALVERTRALVLNVLIAVGAGIALSGLILRTREKGASNWPTEDARRIAFGALFGLFVASYALRRVLGARSALRDPETRRRRFIRAHLAGAIIGALAVPLGFAYAFAVQPTLQAVAPFWVAALACGLLSLPRRDALDGLDPIDHPSTATREPGPP